LLKAAAPSPARLYGKLAAGSAGLIGDLTGGNVWWNGGKLWHRDSNPTWSEMEWMIRNWVNWTWLSGDHIVEQHVHNLDVMNWFFGTHPVKAVGMGSRLRRITGDQYDNFSIVIHLKTGCMFTVCAAR
jgi:predicted dehydrogenase